jgi:hypothetical protein
MNKTLIAIVSAAFAVTSIFTSSAQAGFKGRLAVGLAIGALSVMAHQHRYEEHRRWRERHYAKRHRRHEPVYVKRSEPAPKKADVAEEKVETPSVDTADNENSSITTAALTPAEEPTASTTPSAETADQTAEMPPVEPVAEGPKTANKLDCKKFFPSVGMTLSVPCE